MKNYKATVVSLLAACLSLLIAMPDLAVEKAEETAGAPDRTNASPDKTKAPVSLEKKGEETAALKDMPVYKPPLRGAPEGRVAGGTRGAKDALPMLLALVPDHVGLTVHEQPSLYWFISQTTNYPIELTVIEDQAVRPIMEKRLDNVVKPGIQCVRLTEYGLRLKTGVDYRWFVAVITDPERRSKDIIAGGEVERVEFPGTLRSKLEQAGKNSAPRIYAEEGLWYDALGAVSDLISATPENALFHKQRSFLLEQAGLPEVVEY
jgi:hypothetical protein